VPTLIEAWETATGPPGFQLRTTGGRVAGGGLLGKKVKGHDGTVVSRDICGAPRMAKAVTTAGRILGGKFVE